MTPQIDQTTWQERVESLNVEGIVVDDRAFKLMLGMGEDAFGGIRLLRNVDEALVAAAAAGGGASVASSGMVAGTFFPAGGIMGLLGLGAAVTPLGWVLVGATAAGLGVVGARRGVRWAAKRIAGPAVEVIPRFINTPIDLLAASLFDVMAPLALKVSHVDGECHHAEGLKMREYFTGTWGYNQKYVELGLEVAEANLSAFETEEVAKAFAGMCKDNQDCSFPAIAFNIETFLEDLVVADGRRTDKEVQELDRIRSIFNKH